MEQKAVRDLAEQLGISSQAVIRKAEEYVRLAEVRGTSGISGPCIAALCLELAAVNCGQNVNRESLIRRSGVNKKIYSNCLKSIETLLELDTKTSIPDLAVQFGATNEARQFAIKILRRFESELGEDDGIEYSKSLFNTAALYTACRKLKVKTDKNKMIGVAGVKRSMFEKLVGHMDKCADDITNELKTPQKGKRPSRTFLQELENLPDEHSPNKKVKSGESIDAGEEDYEVWKLRILENAHKSLGKPFNRTPKKASR